MSSNYPALPSRPPSIGGLQPVTALVEIAQKVTEEIPENLRSTLLPILTALASFARTQHDINRQVWEHLQFNALPSRHSGTHKGGVDSLAGTDDGLVSEITLGVDSDAGIPQRGFAPIDHVHGTENLSLLEDLEGALFDGNSLLVEDVRTRKLLEHLLLATISLRETLLLLSVAKSNPEFRYLTWDDLRFAAQSINPVGLTAPPTVDPPTGMLLFSGSVDNAIAGAAQLPHAWAYGTPVRPHLHLRFPTANTSPSRWMLEWDVANPNGSFQSPLGTYPYSNTITAWNANDVLAYPLVPFPEILLPGYDASCTIQWRLSRLPNTDALDTDASDIALVELDFHHLRDKMGTREEY
jgi:hypothetical protein